jgi:hypothetical protein
VYWHYAHAATLFKGYVRSTGQTFFTKFSARSQIHGESLTWDRNAPAAAAAAAAADAAAAAAAAAAASFATSVATPEML